MDEVRRELLQELAAPMEFANAAGAAFFPLDEVLGLLPGKASPALLVTMARLGQELPFGRAALLLEELLGVRVSQSGVRRATLAIGAAGREVEEVAVAVLEEEPSVAKSDQALQQMSVDGAMIRLVGGTFAEVRTMVIGELREGRQKPGLEAANLSYFSRLADHENFTRLATLEVYRRGTDNGRPVVTVNDGAEWIQEFVDLHCPQATRILDWAHASGHLHEVGHALDGSCAGTCKGLLHELAEGTPEQLLGRITARIEEYGRDSAEGVLLAQCKAYFEKREDQIRYREFRERGFPIGSGIVESANKTVVQGRLKGPGMQWLPGNANDLLVLRCASQSSHWRETTARALEALGIKWRERRKQRRLTGCNRRAKAPVLPEPSRDRHRPYFTNGRPTRDHPYNRYPAVSRHWPARPDAKI